MSVRTTARQLQGIVKCIEQLYPVSYADHSWDNTGLLVDSSFDTKNDQEIQNLPVRILLTVDLTQSVAEEAINAGSNLILAYHPFIFRGLKSIRPCDPQQKSLIKLIQSGISVYCPHTAIDAAKGGVNDWLVDGISDGGQNLASKKVIEANPDGVPEVGMGRLIELKNQISLAEAVRKVKSSLGLKYIQIATNSRSETETPLIKTIAICAGSGAGVFKGVDADLYYTGEMSHHEALYYKERGSHVIACNHSNTERGFLKMLKTQLAKQFSLNEIDHVTIDISKTDRDPYEVV